MIGRTVSHYEIRRELGTGAMGVVYEAWDTRLERLVALKFLHADLTRDARQKKRFKHEALAASSLDHPNICYINEVDETEDGRLFISMAYYDGVSLSDRLRKAPLPVREAFQIGYSIAQGLSSAHQHGIVHRDVKPANVMITSEGFVKIVDFGLAKLTGRSRVTVSGTTVGTVAYMSPEQAIGENIDHRTDIWAVGVILYEMVTGQLPFRGDIDQAMIYSIINEDPKPAREFNKDVPRKCSEIIVKCLEKNVEKRYQTMDELVADLAILAGTMGWGSSIAAMTTLRVNAEDASVRRRRRLRAVSLLTLFVAAAGFAVWKFVIGPARSVYSTDVRLAVLPTRNLGPPEHGPMVDGIFEVTTQMADHASRLHRSMWVVSSRWVVSAQLASAADARDAFGVNRILVSDVQRFKDGFRLFLQLQDATSLSPIRSATVDFDPESCSALADSLPLVVAHVVGLPDPSELSAYLPSVHAAVRPYLDGLGYLRNNRLDSHNARAVSSFENALVVDRAFVMGQTSLAQGLWESYLGAGDDSDLRDRALAHMVEAAERSSQLWHPWFNLGELYRLSGQDSSAAIAYRKALDIDPGNPDASRRLGDVFRQQDRIAEAEFVMKGAIGKRPDLFSNHLIMGLHYFRIGDYRKAVAPLERATELAPDESFSLNTLGAAYLKLGEWVMAREAFQEAFKLLPNCETCGNIGLVLYYEGKYEDSASYFEYQFEYCDTTDYQKWGSLATSLYWVDGERKRSLEIFEKAIRLAKNELEKDPNDPVVIAALIEYYTMSGRKENALAMIERARPFVGNNSDIMFSIGDAYEQFGDREKALYYLGNAVRHNHSVPEIMAARELKDLVRDTRFQELISRYRESRGAGDGGN